MRALSTFGLIATLVGCTPTDSSTLQPGDMIAKLTVTTTAAGWSVFQGDLSTSHGCIAFSKGDALSISGGGGTTGVDVGGCSGFDFTTSIFAALPAVKAGDLVTLTFLRNGRAASTSTITLPKSFTLNYESSPDSFSRSKDDYELTWDTDPTDAQTMSWTATGSCITTRTQTGVTSVSLPKGSLGGTGGTCDIHIAVLRVVTGTAGFGAGSSFTATQQRGVTVESRP